MNQALTECPNCHTSLKSGMFSSVKLQEQPITKFINAVNNTDIPGYCTKCGGDLYAIAVNTRQQRLEETKKLLMKAMAYVPVISAQNPLNWDYEVLTMVTGQSTTGTGVFAEVAASWTDFFGAQSGIYNEKLKAGETLCFAQLKKQVIDLGGNAVIATDIDYSEVGGGKGMLMVCMAGTAVRVKNPEVFGQIRKEKLEELISLNEKLKGLLATQVPDVV